MHTKEKIFGVVLAGGKGARFGPLAGQISKRSKPAVPFANLRIIDFVLNNFINSGIDDIAVLIQTFSHSLDDHISRGYQAYMGRNGKISTYTAPLMNGHDRYLGTANAVYYNIDRIEDDGSELVAIFGGDHIYKMDVSMLAEHHKNNNADMTIAAVAVPLSEASKYGVIEVDENWRIIGFQEKPDEPRHIPGEPDKALVSMGNYTFNKNMLIKLLKEDNAKEFVTKAVLKELMAKDPDAMEKNSTHDFGYDIIETEVAKGKLRIFAYDFRNNIIPGISEGEEPHYWRDVGDLIQYWQASMDVCAIKPKLNLYNPEWPLWTLPIAAPPAKFVFNSPGIGRAGHALDSLVSPGAIISGGKVENSIIGSYVKVNSWSHIYQSILFGSQGPGKTEVGRHSRLRNTIVDKNVIIPEHTEIGYDRAKDIERGFTVVDMGSEWLTVVPKGYKFK